jgi:hypothetical protein
MPVFSEVSSDRPKAPRDFTDEKENTAGLAGFVCVDGWLLLPIVICSCQSLQQ